MSAEKLSLLTVLETAKDKSRAIIAILDGDDGKAVSIAEETEVVEAQRPIEGDLGAAVETVMEINDMLSSVVSRLRETRDILG
jgi:hypothetical protein